MKQCVKFQEVSPSQIRENFIIDFNGSLTRVLGHNFHQTTYVESSDGYSEMTTVTRVKASCEIPTTFQNKTRNYYRASQAALTCN